MSDKILQNLIDFYLEFKKDNYVEHSFFHSFLGKWPNCNIDKGEDKEININFEDENYSKNWFLTESFVKKNKEQIKKAKLFPVGKWTNMYLKKEALFPVEKTLNFSIHKLNKNEIESFVKIVNASFNKEIFSFKLIEEQLSGKNFLFLSGKLNNHIVSTAVFYNNENTIGLYFIATKKEYQKKGFASKTIINGMNHFIQKGFTNFILHSTDSGKNLYKKLGFIPENKLRIFVKI
jgi:ribosomal protein S18 acetylase RimI-like enzyme